MAIIQDWKIRSRAHRCIDTDRPFEDGERVCTGIFADPESDGYLRKDYCLEAWGRLKDSLEPYSFWQATYRIPEEEADVEDLGKESPETMLRRLIDEDEPHTENARYILALMLERKKTLIPVDTKEMESRRMLFYEHKENGDVFVVADPQLRLDEVAQIQEEVALLLQGRKAGKEGDQVAAQDAGDTETGSDSTDLAADSAATGEPDSTGTSTEAASATSGEAIGADSAVPEESPTDSAEDPAGKAEP